MAAGEGTEALIHLSAVVSVLAIAYVGLDRAEHGLDQLDDGFKDIKQRAEQLIQQIDISGAVSANFFRLAKWRSVTVIYPSCIICMLAGVPVRLGLVHTPIFFVYRQFRIPFFKYFRDHMNILLVGAMALVSTSMFIAICGLSIWQSNIVDEPRYQRMAFLVLAGIAAWILFTGGLSLLLRKQRLMKLCEKLHEVVRNRLNKRLDEALAVVAGFNAPAAPDGAGVDPP